MANTSPFLKRFEGQVSFIAKDGSQKKGHVSTKRASTNPEKASPAFNPKFPAINNRTADQPTYSNSNGTATSSGGAIKMANNGYSSNALMTTNSAPNNNNRSINIQRIDQQGYGYPIQPEPPLSVQLPPLSKSGMNSNNNNNNNNSGGTPNMQYNNITVNGTDPSVDYLHRLAESAYKEFPTTQFAPTMQQYTQQQPQPPPQQIQPQQPQPQYMFPSQAPQVQLPIQYRNSSYTQPQAMQPQQAYPAERYSYPPYQPSQSMYNMDSNSYAQQYQYSSYSNPTPTQPSSIANNNNNNNNNHSNIYNNNNNINNNNNSNTKPTLTQPPPLSFPETFQFGDQNNDDELKTPSSRDGSPKKVSKKDQLYYSRQPREVYFKPYTQSDYKAKKMEIASMKMGSLGPDLQNEDYLARKEKIQRMKEYAERAKALQGSSPSRSSPASAPSTMQTRSAPTTLLFTQTKEEQRLALEKRQKAMEFARAIPRPRPKPKVMQTNGITSGLPANHPWLIGRDEGEEEEDEQAELQNLEMQHQLARQTVVQIRKEVMG